MKKLLSLFLIAGTLVGCSSDDDGGTQGPPGEDGVNIVGQAFEIDADFNDPDYSVFADIPSSIEVLESDVVLVYWLELVDDGNDVWNLIPQTIYFEGMRFQYNYNHTTFDVNIYLQGNIGLETIGERYTQDQVFKVVVLPVDYAQDNNLDVSNYQAVKTSLDLNDSNIKRFEVK